jgi:hypothetical protein
MNIYTMNPAPVIDLSSALRRDRRLPRIAEARRRLAPRRPGRAWINGTEVGGSDKRFAHIERSHD